MAALITTPRLMAVGGGALADLPSLMARLGLSRPLIVTDPYIAGSGILDRATGLLGGARISWSVFSDTVSDPTTEVIGIGVQHLRDGGFDSLVAIGGGSSIDTAKGMSVLFANGGQMRDYKVPAEIPQAGLPIIAIPTTAGTGSEVTRFTVVTDTETDEKMLIAGLACCPSAAIVDYELTLTMPLRLTADTGIDSLTHAIEAYVSRRANPFTDGLARNAMGLIARHIRTACTEPQNRPAREAMMLGATTAGMAFSNASVALVHGMSRPIGAHFHLAHGLSNALLLPTVTRFSVVGAPERYAHVAREMRLATDEDSDQVACDRLVEELEALNADLKIPSLSEAGVERDHFDRVVQDMAQAALDSGSPGFNPQPATTEQIVELYRQAY
jgi:alcohol dehydrogenase class IV